MPGAWTVGAAISQHACRQSLLHADGLFLEGDMDPLRSQPSADGLTAALQGSEVIAIREWHPSGPPAAPSDWIVDFSKATVVESGHVGAPGELWWGRISGGPLHCCSVGKATDRPLPADRLNAASEGESLFFAIGQETRIRQFWSATSPDQLTAMLTGALGPWPVGARTLHFDQYAATAIVSRTSSPISPGQISHASLDLSVTDHLSGVLTLTLSSDGETGQLSIPIKRDVEEAMAARIPMAVPGSPYRVRQGRKPVSGPIEDCYERPGSRTLSDRCYFDDQEGALTQHSVQEQQYRVRGMFFGGDGEYLAIVLQTMPARPSDPVRLWGDLHGLVILKRTKWN